MDKRLFGGSVSYGNIKFRLFMEKKNNWGISNDYLWLKSEKGKQLLRIISWYFLVNKISVYFPIITQSFTYISIRKPKNLLHLFYVISLQFSA